MNQSATPDTADTVLHTPSGEEWLVAFVENGSLCACGWPCSFVPVADCQIIEKASAAKRRELLETMAAMSGSDARKSYAMRTLAALNEPAVGFHPRDEFEVREEAIGPTILLVSGAYFSFDHPERTPVPVEDIAHALSHICRFTGHCRAFYSVAQHAVLTSYLAPPEFAFHALHHDDAEAVLGDVSSPLKRLIPQYKAIERRVEAVILAQFGLPADMPPDVKHADLVALRTEQRDLMHKAGGLWKLLDGIEPSHEFQVAPMPPLEAAALYLRRHRELLGATQ